MKRLAPLRINLPAFLLCLFAITLGACAGAVGEGDDTGPAGSLPGPNSMRPGTAAAGTGGAPAGINKSPGVGGVPQNAI